MGIHCASDLALLGAERTRMLIGALRTLDEEALNGDSELPGWSRLMIACHLRYGATAFLRMTRDALAGRPTAYYPEGRTTQRPGTLHPRPDERPGDVLDSWEAAAADLDAQWSTLAEPGWSTEAREPPDNPDLGTLPLSHFALARLLEVDVHGTDLGIGFPDWSELLVDVALPSRLQWLRTRRTNHRLVDGAVQGSWLLAADDGAAWLGVVDGDRVTTRPAADDEDADAVITTSRRDLLALLLGRPPLSPLRITGDEDLGAAFTRAFPGP